MTDRELLGPDVAQEVTLRPPPGKTIGMLVLWVAFLAGGLWLLDREIGWGWIAAILGVIGILLSGISLLPGASYLRLTSDGFTVGSLFNRHDLRWRDATNFRAFTVGANKGLVGFDFVDETGEIYDSEPGVIPDTYGLDIEDLVELMREWRSSHYPSSRA